MQKVVVGVLAVITLFSLAEGLTCNTCAVGILGKCLFSSQVSCTSSQTSCFTASAVFNLTGSSIFSTSGCTNNCNSTTGSVMGVGYTISRFCCSTNQCNGASSVQMSALGVLSAALAGVLGSSVL